MRFVEVPVLVPRMRAWQARVGGFSFVITYEPNKDEGFEDFTGYTASWKNMAADMTAFGSQPANKIDGAWEKFADAEDACRATLKQLRRRQ